MAAGGLVLHGQPGWGSAIVETQLAFYGLPFRFEATGDLFESEAARARLRALNPLAQVPVLELADGSVIEPNFWILLGILLAFSWVALVGVVRAEFLRARNFEYVTAARALGLPSLKIIFRHLLPNAMVATLTFMPFILNGSITTLTSLDFLGFGLPPGSPSLGELLAQGKDNLQAPWLGLTAFFVIAIMLSLLIFVGEAVRDALDPRKTLN